MAVPIRCRFLLKVWAGFPSCLGMGTFADVLSEATQTADRFESPAPSPFAHAVRVFEDRVIDAALGNVAARMLTCAQASCARYARRPVGQPASLRLSA